MDNKALRVSESEAKETLKVINHNKALRNYYASNRRGYTYDRGKTMKHRMSVPISFIFHPEYKKYFDPMADIHEDKKNMDMFLRLFPCFDVSR